MIARSRRILVIGCAGSGKSTLSRGLSDVLDIPHVPMDRAFFWLPGWKLRERGEMRRLIGEAVTHDAWIMDGTSPGTLQLRLPRADVVVWMRVPRWICLWASFPDAFATTSAAAQICLKDVSNGSTANSCAMSGISSAPKSLKFSRSSTEMGQTYLLSC